MIKTSIENGQNLIIEGCYIPFDWSKDFENNELSHIQYYCLIMSKEYIENHFFRHPKIFQRDRESLERWVHHGNCTGRTMQRYLELAQRYLANYVLINDKYAIDIDLPSTIFHS